MKIPEIAIKNPVFSWMLMASLVFFGFISFFQTGISQLPDVDFPVLNISIRLEGAAPTVIENDVIDPVEDALSGLEGIRQIQSTARHSMADITVELDLKRDIDVSVQEIQAVLSQAQRVLPKDMEPPVIRKSNPEDNPILWLAVTTSGETKDLMSYVRYTLRDRFQAIPGVGDIILGGYVDRTMQIDADINALARYELSINDISATIQSEHIEQPAGRQDFEKQEIPLRAMGEAGSAKAISELPIMSRGGAPVFRTIRLGDVAKVQDGLGDIRRISRVNGKKAVGMGIRKQRGSNTVEIGQRVKKMMQEVSKNLPPGYEILISFDSTVFIEEAIHELEFTIILSVLLTGLILWIFLGELSSTVNVLLAIPTSILGTFIFIQVMGFTLNTFTLLALSLAIGIVVDDAIMVLENITRHREEGKSPFKAALDGSVQITFAAVAATFSIVAIFMPVAYMEGVIGKYFYQFGITISVAIVISLVEALTLTSMRASQFRVGKKPRNRLSQKAESVLNKSKVVYERYLQKALNRPRTILVISFIAFLASLGLLIPLKKEFVPPQDQGRVMVRLRTPAGSSLEFTDNLVKKVEEKLLTRKEVLRIFVAIGGLQGGISSQAMVFITLQSPDKRMPVRDFIKILRKELNEISPQLKAAVQDPSLQGFSATRGFPVEFSISGPDWNVLERVSTELQASLRKNNKLADVDTNLILGQNELHITPNREAANLRGVSMSEITNAISTMFGGKIAGKFSDGGHRYDIRVRLHDNYRNSQGILKKIYVRNNRSELVPLSDVVKSEIKPSLQQINRINRQRSVILYANNTGGATPAQALQEAVQQARKILPVGYILETQGVTKTESESFKGLYIALLLGVLIAYMILASQFNSYIHPLTVLLALPFSFTGAIAVLYLFGFSLNIFSFIGLILLMGLVKKNSILIVEFTNEIRESGISPREALLQAAPIRLRPILITSITTMSAALPPALALGPGSETRVPMAVAILGGMALSTLLTLFVIPCAYLLFSRFERQKQYNKDEPGESGLTLSGVMKTEVENLQFVSSAESNVVPPISVRSRRHRKRSG